MVYSNLWILRQADYVSIDETITLGTEVLFSATSDHLPSHPSKLEEPQTAVSP